MQEALTNCLRHAGQAQVAVQARYDADALRVRVVDDGRSDTADAPVVAGDRGGQGLIAMRERVAMVGGTLDVGPRPGGGWSVCAVLPTTRVGLT